MPQHNYGVFEVNEGDTRIPLEYFLHPLDGHKCYPLTCGGTRYDSCEYSFVVARGHVVQGIGGHTPRTITELSAKELADVFDNEDTQRDIGAAYVSESHNDITLDGTWNVSDLLTALAAKLAEEG